MSVDETRTRPSAEHRASPLRPLLGCALVVAAALGWYVAARASIGKIMERQDEQALKSAGATFDEQLKLTETRLKADAQLLAEDPRLRATLATPGVDEATVVDILKDVQRLLTVDLVAVLTPDGQVLAVIGEPSLSAIDLSATDVVKSSQQSDLAMTAAWGLGERFLSVAVVGIRFGGRSVGSLVIGQSYAADVLASAYHLSGASGALLIGARIAAVFPPEDRAVVEQAMTLAPGPASVLDHQGQRFLARVEEKGKRARVVWLRRAEANGEEFRILVSLLWVPALAAVLLGLWACWTSVFERRSAGSMGVKSDVAGQQITSAPK